MIKQTILTGMVVDESAKFSLTELSHACNVSEQWLLTLVDQGVLEPLLPEQQAHGQAIQDQSQWRFQGTCLQRIRVAHRLEIDLGVNPAGAALAMELLEEVEALRRRLAILEHSR